MYKSLRKIFSENVYLFLGIFIGMYFSSMLSTSLDTTCNRHPKAQEVPEVKHHMAQVIINSSVDKFAPKVLLKKPSPSKKGKLIRPRYYSTELGIREKLFVGIFTSEEKINNQALHINKTIGHLVDKIKFFMTAQYKMKTALNLTGLVGFTDSRSKYRPFQVLKYVCDTFGQEYDYYFFANDYTFINAHKLKDVVKKISVSMDIYLGTRVEDGSYCSLDSGIIISNSVLKALRKHLDWCIMNAISEDQSENIGRCIHHSLGLSCQETVQLESLPSFKLKHFELGSHLKKLVQNQYFNSAVTVYPVLQKDDFYILNAHFLKQRLMTLKDEVNDLSSPLTENWPPGQRAGSKPATRFDLPKQLYFNMSHVFFSDDFTNIREHTEAEMMDIENILEEIKSEVANKYKKDLQFRKLMSGIKTFDLSRGMDYTLDISFRDLNTGKEVIKRFEVCKPLGKIEFIPVPYMTENTRVNIILPIQETEISLGVDFLTTYAKTIMDRKEKTFLMLVFLYQFNSESKGTADPFHEIKNFATKATSKYRNDDAKIAWLSVRLPSYPRPLFVQENQALNFAIVDLTLKKIGLDSLSLLLDVYCNITVDFLNRVRMNTIPHFQVFSPIPFRQYNPKISQHSSLEINKYSGHFDREEYKYISFYGRDYVFARKKYERFMPLVRTDNDISNVIDEDHRNTGNIFEMFLKFSENLHCMRATEMNLRIKYHEEKCPSRRNLFLGTENQLAKLLLTENNILL
ncbi:unnamed protein product [Phaedon cochleariae]|uniref:Hexosyltransferase n=1 Tax=Phaedon cochleariae TaxID=80249 RepID=A0A9P0DEW8_PHACE|nr:unnamed protein product [Phaedon cochleariae]